MRETERRTSRIRRWWSFAAYLWSRLRETYDDYRQFHLGGASGLVLGDGVVCEGTPLLMVSGGGRVVIGAGVVLDSRNRGYHANMFGPVKLVANTPGALIEIGEQSRIHGTCIHARERVRIGKRCLVAANCQILDSNGHDSRVRWGAPADRYPWTSKSRRHRGRRMAGCGVHRAARRDNRFGHRGGCRQRRDDRLAADVPRSWDSCEGLEAVLKYHHLCRSACSSNDR